MRPRKKIKQEKRVQVNFLPSEFEIVLKKAAASGETAPSLLRRIVMEALTGKHEANSKSESETLEHGLDFL